MSLKPDISFAIRKRILAPTAKLDVRTLGTSFSIDRSLSYCVVSNPVVPTTIRLSNCMIFGMLFKSEIAVDTNSTTSLSATALSISDALVMRTLGLFPPTSVIGLPTKGLVSLLTAPVTLMLESVREIIERPNFPVAPTTHRLVGIVIQSLPVLFVGKSLFDVDVEEV